MFLDKVSNDLILNINLERTQIHHTQKMMFSTKNTSWYSEAQIAEISAKARISVDIKDRKCHFKTIRSCFIGREFCKWLIVNGVS